ncbi:dihydrofolate reductase [Pedobacter sp. CG_S7]|uniref:dihydrofolate reductase n=1 Tax=Pedobacter sp. CG_S7 TaxID=3143930 RepID=UPI003390D688
MIVSLVVAMSTNNAIGKDNQLLWHLPADLKHFKDITSGHTIIMGRKTYESVGKALPNRRNIVITRNTHLKLTGVEVMHSLKEALNSSKEENEVFIIGGAEIFNQSIKLANKIYLTRINESYEADTFFPEIDKNCWLESELEHHLPDEKNALSYSFSTLTSN